MGKATPPRAALAPAVHGFGASLLGMRRFDGLGMA